MHIYYRMDKLNIIIKSLAELLGANILVLNSNAEYLAYYSTNDKYCSSLKVFPEFIKKCADCDRRILERCMESSSVEMHYCHAGLCDVAIPITKDSVLVAYVILGGIRTSTSPDTPKYKLCDNSEELYSSITTFTEAQLKNLTELLPYIVFNSAIVIENDSILDEIVEYIRSNPSADLSVKALCRRFFISKNVLYKAFDKEYGCTVKSFTERTRIEAAAKLLLDTSSRIMQIAEQTGFNNYTVFCKTFKEQFRMTPSEYRNLNKGKK